MTAPTHARLTPPPFGKVTVYHVTTGAAFERWPVDARGMIANGECTWSPLHETLPRPEWARGLTERADTTADPLLAPVHSAPVDDAPPFPPAGPKLTPLGEPVVASRRGDASPAAPAVFPTGYTGKRDKPGRR